MAVIPKKGGPWSLFCTDCGVWTPNTANTEMRKEGFYAHSHICGHFDKLFEVRDADWRKRREQEGKKMYEDLVNRLNSYSAEHECHGGITAEASDAIEELDTLLDGVRADNEALCETIEMLKKQVLDMSSFIKDYSVQTRWIPVKERMPDAYEEVLLQFSNNQAAGFCDKDGCWGVYSGDRFYTEVADNEPKPTHWAKKLPEPLKANGGLENETNETL